MDETRLYLYERQSNQQSMVWKHPTSSSRQYTDHFDLLGFECFEHVSYSPDCTSVYVAVFAEVGFTWETIHWYCRDSLWTYDLQLLHMATRGTATFTTYGWIVTISAWTAGEYFENNVTLNCMLAFLSLSAPLLWKGIM